MITLERLGALWYLLWLTPITVLLYRRRRDFAWARNVAWVGIAYIIVVLYMFIVDPLPQR